MKASHTLKMPSESASFRDSLRRRMSDEKLLETYRSPEPSGNERFKDAHTGNRSGYGWSQSGPQG